MIEPKTILVTGASTGIGRALCEHLSRQGHTVFATMRALTEKNERHAESLRTLAAQEKLALIPLELDVRDEESVRSAVEAVSSQSGRLDVLINNAGVMAMGIAEAISTDQFQSMLDVNVLGAFRLCQAVLPRMRKQRDGLLVWTSSLGASLRYPFMGLYGATKAAMEAMAESLHYELFGCGIDSVIVQAGMFSTALGDNVELAMNESMASEYGVAGQIATEFSTGFRSLLASPAASSPQLFAEAVAEQIARPRGTRTLRLAVGAHSEVMSAINPVLNAVMAQVIPGLGMGALLQRQHDGDS